MRCRAARGARTTHRARCSSDQHSVSRPRGCRRSRPWPAEPGTDRRAALVVGASFSHRAQGGSLWPDGAGMPDPQPQAPPTNPAPEPAIGRQLHPWPASLASPLAPGGLAACHGVHRPPGPRAGQTARPGNRKGHACGSSSRTGWSWAAEWREASTTSTAGTSARSRPLLIAGVVDDKRLGSGVGGLACPRDTQVSSRTA
jgi:hypothetical protein